MSLYESLVDSKYTHLVHDGKLGDKNNDQTSHIDHKRREIIVRIMG